MSPINLAALLAAFVVTSVAGGGFLGVYLSDLRATLLHPDPRVRTVSWHLALNTLVVVLEAVVFALLITVAHHLPVWIFVVGFWASALIMVHRFILVIVARRR